MPQFSGIIPPVVTPLRTFDQLDLSAVEHIVGHLLSGGVNGLFVLGTTGEGPSLNYQIRYEMVERTCEVVKGNAPVLVGVTDTSLQESIDLARHAASSGAAAVVAAAPYYFQTSQKAVFDWFTALADASPLPLMLYNMPGCVEIVLSLDTIERLSAHDNIVGVKDSGGDLSYFRQLCQQFQHEDFAVFMGPEELIPQAVEAGADGGVCGGGNLLPSVYVKLFNAAKNGDAAEIKRLVAIVDQMFQHIYKCPNGNMNLIPALKYAMSQAGLCSNVIAPPLLEPSPEHLSQIRSQLPDLLSTSMSPLSMIEV